MASRPVTVTQYVQVMTSLGFDFRLNDAGSIVECNGRRLDDFKLAASQETPYHQVVDQQKPVAPPRWQLCDVQNMHQAKHVFVNPMGCAIWDVGLGLALLIEEFIEEREKLYP